MSRILLKVHSPCVSDQQVNLISYCSRVPLHNINQQIMQRPGGPPAVSQRPPAHAVVFSFIKRSMRHLARISGIFIIICTVRNTFSYQLVIIVRQLSQDSLSLSLFDQCLCSTPKRCEHRCSAIRFPRREWCSHRMGRLWEHYIYAVTIYEIHGEQERVARALWWDTAHAFGQSVHLNHWRQVNFSKCWPGIIICCRLYWFCSACDKKRTWLGNSTFTFVCFWILLLMPLLPTHILYMGESGISCGTF